MYSYTSKISGTWWEMNLRKPKVTEADLLVSYNSDPGEMDLRLG